LSSFCGGVCAKWLYLSYAVSLIIIKVIIEMTKTRIAGVIVTFLGIAMFPLGIAGFSGSLPNSLREVGIFSFGCWFPALILGIILIAVGRRRKG
jgi:hypothetical protein